ncbi:MAG: DUF2249 domain-containing protein [Chryseobacterium sp.]|nr:MAG: DUF2249 domain-containing protein [Chryseobacterium sp.]
MKTSVSNSAIEIRQGKSVLITTSTRIKTLLDVDMEGVISTLVKLNNNFSKLKNPTLRNLLAHRVTIADACRIARCDKDVFLNAMKLIGFSIGAVEEEVQVLAPKPIATDEQKVFDLVLSRFEPQKIIYLDVCHLEMPQPMLLIIEHIEKLGAGEALYVYHKKIPVFLLPELDQRGLSYLLNRKSAVKFDILIYSNECK